MKKMKIEIWSDIACPYCYIGKRKLENALQQFPHNNEIELVWHSYELDPSLPKTPVKESFYDFYCRKFRTNISQAGQDLGRLIDLAKEVGLEYRFDLAVAANTSDALRFIKLANTHNLATEAEEVLFKAYFNDGEDISCKNTLIKLGLELGIPQNEVEQMLSSDKYLADIKEDIRYGEESLNLHYIPFYWFNKQEMIQGAIDQEDYLKVLEKSYLNWKQGKISDGEDDIITGQSCTIDGICS